MRYAIILVEVLAAFVPLSHGLGDGGRIESYPSNHLLEEQVLLHVPANPVAGLLVLLPAGNIHSYDEQGGYTPAKLPRMLATNQIMTLVTAARPGHGAGVGLFAEDAVLEELDALISDVCNKYRIPHGKVAMGGFSAGGIGAVRYAEFCVTKKGKTPAPCAVFAVDSPLDFERWFLASELELKRLALAGRNDAEDRAAVEELRKGFAGSPAEKAETYRRQSAVSASLADGGNARLLENTPIRLYIEPDLRWRLENWSQDVYGSNIPDATALINVLRLLGNQDAELITTSDKGYRPDGRRNPHSWSIVDESALAQWLLKFMGAQNGGDK
jgi:hypothetical protein